MSDDCCPPGSDEPRTGPGSKKETKEPCPECGNIGREVPHATLYHVLKPFVAREVSPEEQYRVCKTRDCPVLYFGKESSDRFTCDEARVRVGFKLRKNDAPNPVCYCFGYTKENIAREIDQTGESSVVDWISERVQAGKCACKYKNPTGSCCLEEVRQVVDAFRT